MTTNAFCVLAHTDPEMFGRLAKALHAVGPVFAHINSRFDIEPFRRASPETVFIPQRFPIVWGAAPMIDASLALLENALDDPSVERCTLVSGRCYPIRSDGFLAGNWFDRDWIAALPAPDPSRGKPFERFTHRYWAFDEPESKVAILANGLWHRLVPGLDLDREFGPLGGLRAGSQWWSLRRATVERTQDWIARNPRTARLLQNLLCPDEVFFQTIVGHVTPVNELRLTGSTYAKWSSETEHPHPLPLDERDIREQIDAGRFVFMRKLNPDQTQLPDLMDDLRNGAVGRPPKEDLEGDGVDRLVGEVSS